MAFLSVIRPFNAVICIALLVMAAFSAEAQGQTPTSPQDRPSSSGRRLGSSSLSSSSDESQYSQDGGGNVGSAPQQGRGSSASWSRKAQLNAASGDKSGSKDDGDSESSSSRRRPPSQRGRETSEAPPEARQKDGVEGAAADRGPGRDASSSEGRGTATPRTIGGNIANTIRNIANTAAGNIPGVPGVGGVPPTGGAPGIGGTAGFSQGAVGGVTMTGQGAFEPVMEREPEYKDVPDAGEKMTLEGPMPLTEFLAALNLATNWNMIVSPELQDIQLQFWMTETAPKDALEVLKFNKVYYEFDEENKFLRIMTKEEFLKREFGKAKPTEFKVKHADVAYIESMVNSLLSSTGRVITDQRTNNIYVWDTEDNIKEMQRIVDEIDIPLQKAEFIIEHAELPDIEAVLASQMSPSGNILSDVRTGQIFVWDSPNILDQMRTAVARLDQPVESKTFFVTHVSAEDIVDSVESLLTERGMMQVDPRFNTIIVTDLPQRIARIESVIQTLDQELETRTWVLKYADLDFVADQIETYIPGEMGQIVIQDEVHQITVTGLPARLDEIDKLINVWDIMRQQVLIEAHIVEVSNEIERAFNVNWSYFSNVDGSPFALHSGSGSESIAGPAGSGQIASGGERPYAIPRYGALQLNENGKITRPLLKDIAGNPIIDSYRGGNIGVTLDYLDKQEKATILSSPRVTVQDGEEALFENATRVPYVSASSYFGGYSSSSYQDNNSNYPYSRMNNTSRVEFIDVGTILSVLPRITEESNILLDISAEDSTFTDKNIVVDDLSRTVPEKTVRRAETQVRVNSGDTIILGGLRRDRAGHSTTRTPILGDLPLIGRIFQNPKRTSKNASLLIFITTTIVDENTMPESVQVAQADSEIADARRQEQKGILDRLRNYLDGGTSEIGISIGQNGYIFCRGQNVTTEELREIFFDAPKILGTSAIIRKHPNAPVEVVNEVTEAAMEAGLRIEFDMEIPPIVPSLEIPKQ